MKNERVPPSPTYPIPEDKYKVMTPRFYETQADDLINKFKAKFEEPHRKLKAAIHRCQANAYSKQGLSLEESEI